MGRIREATAEDVLVCLLSLRSLLQASSVQRRVTMTDTNCMPNGFRIV